MKRVNANAVIIIAALAIIAIAFLVSWKKDGSPLSVLQTPAAVASDNETWADSVRKELGHSQASLQAMDDKGAPLGDCPLKHTEVKADISGFIARVTVKQEYTNPYKDKIEAVYVFPLSNNSAVDDMTMLIGDRVIRGQIKRKQEARQIYEEAKNSGHVASLLEQERPNIFTQSVANIMPGEKITITISYVEYLKYQDGEYEFVFPMVVGPRYIPGAPSGQQGTGWSSDTTRVPDASRITPPVTPEGTRAGHDISINVSINAGFPIQGIESELHEVLVTRRGDNRADIALKDRETIPNKDFILKYKTAGSDISDALLTHATAGEDGYFTLIMQPPARVPVKKITPKEMIFVIDTSGSQMGWPIEKAKETMKHAINNMNPDDTFQLLSFSNGVDKLFPKPGPNTAANREKALRFLAEKLGGGGTDMLKGIDAALDPAPDPERLRIVCFMTDGYVGNDMEIIGAVKKKIGNARLFSFGVGNSVNRFLLDELARVGLGEVEYVTLEADGKAAAARFYERIANPVLTDIKIDWGGLPVKNLYPDRVPDLYSHKPVVIKGQYKAGGGSGKVKITGRYAGGKFEKEIIVNLPAGDSENGVLAPLWARARIDDLMRQDFPGIQNGSPRADIEEIITGLGIQYRIMTQYTSFVAVEEQTITEGGAPRTIAVPVEMPDGVSYQGVFGTETADTMTGALQTRGGGVGVGTYGSYGITTAMPSVAPTGAVPMSGKHRESKSIYSPNADMLAADGDKEENEPAPATTEAQTIAAKLASALEGLAAKVEKQGKSGNLEINGLTVKDWNVEIMVTVKDNEKATIDGLEKLGLTVLKDIKSGKNHIIIGRIDVRKLDKFALNESVLFVEPLIQ